MAGRWSCPGARADRRHRPVGLRQEHAAGRAAGRAAALGRADRRRRATWPTLDPAAWRRAGRATCRSGRGCSTARSADNVRVGRPARPTPRSWPRFARVGLDRLTPDRPARRGRRRALGRAAGPARAGPGAGADRPVVLLDEPTAHLDAATEADPARVCASWPATGAWWSSRTGAPWSWPSTTVCWPCQRPRCVAPGPATAGFEPATARQQPWSRRPETRGAGRTGPASRRRHGARRPRRDGRGGPDRDGRLADRPGGRAPAGADADGRDRRGAHVRAGPAGAAVRRAAGLPRRGPAAARRAPRAGLRRPGAARARSAGPPRGDLLASVVDDVDALLDEQAAGRLRCGPGRHHRADRTLVAGAADRRPRSWSARPAWCRGPPPGGRARGSRRHGRRGSPRGPTSPDRVLETRRTPVRSCCGRPTGRAGPRGTRPAPPSTRPPAGPLGGSPPPGSGRCSRPAPAWCRRRRRRAGQRVRAGAGAPGARAARAGRGGRAARRRGLPAPSRPAAATARLDALTRLTPAVTDPDVAAPLPRTGDVSLQAVDAAWTGPTALHGVRWRSDLRPRGRRRRPLGQWQVDARRAAGAAPDSPRRHYRLGGTDSPPRRRRRTAAASVCSTTTPTCSRPRGRERAPGPPDATDDDVGAR